MQCDCKRGYRSDWDYKCGHCRTNKEAESHEKTLIEVDKLLSSNRLVAIKHYRFLRNLKYLD